MKEHTRRNTRIENTDKEERTNEKEESSEKGKSTSNNVLQKRRKTASRSGERKE